MTLRPVKIYFDGGCRPNPGTIEVAVVVRGAAYYFDDLGHGSNNDAEWLAIIAARRLAHRLGETHFVLLGDSAVVVDQANHRSRCRAPDLQAHFDRFDTMEEAAPLHIRRIARTQNLAGIALEARRRHAPVRALPHTA